VARLTSSRWFNAWDRRRFAGRYDHPGRGRPPKRTAAEQEHAHQYMTQHPQHMKQVVHLIAPETAQRVSTTTMKRLLQKTAMSGNGARTPQSRSQIRRPMSAAHPCCINSPPVKALERVMGSIGMRQDLAWHPLFLRQGSLLARSWRSRPQPIIDG
jgi:hypothetical protein